MIQTSGTAVIEHRDSGRIYEIPNGDIQWEDMDTYERDMGPEVLWVARVYHDELGELTWSLTEYPEGAISGTPEADVNGHVLRNDFSFEIAYDEPDPDPDDYVFDNVPSSVSAADAREMREWFHANYEDPANSLPYSSADGGYQWVNGGPYSPLEALQEEFDSAFSFESIEAIAQTIVDEDGTYEWSPRQTTESAEERIVRLASRLDRHLPLAERLVLNEETGAFRAVATLAAKQDLLKATLVQIRDALDDCVALQSNGLAEHDHEVRKLRRMLASYAENPQRIEMDVTSVHRSISAKIRKEELPRSEAIEDLLYALDDAARGIRATDSNIAENRRILQSADLNKLSNENVQTIIKAAPVLEAITEGELQLQMQDDIAILAEYDGQLGGVSRRDGFGHDEIVRVVGRAARMVLAIKNAPKIVGNLEANHLVKAAGVLTTLYGIIEIGIKAFSFFFA
ncbi:hypothetical protein J2Y48_000690 [Mycoplana sp. BE70]|uniref:hypothetical protein n=1 Tax=Mycoplana sp. BE70 TaxID=2817775 RepID=UPI0028573E79|nr:hypothetical protein [Mycoplana sp. BE70]MDR6755405.1 hypothetical protein [Mycoplana sp. BE70]